jgi:predicted metal-binding membrane protein
MNTKIEPSSIDPPERVFLGTSFLLFAASVAGTMYWSRSMHGGMAMPGGWTMSMAWMKMPGQSWLGMIASFMGMWMVMMAAMMLPSLAPRLSSYRRAIRSRDGSGLSTLTLLAGAGYIFVWAVLGAIALALGTSLAAIEMRSPAFARSAPMATGFVLLLAGCLQLTPWKARQLDRCRVAPACVQPLDTGARSAWNQGIRLGVHCGLCCLSFTMILLVTGVMNLAVMAVLAIAINMERFIRRPEIASRAAGLATIAAAILVYF